MAELTKLSCIQYFAKAIDLAVRLEKKGVFSLFKETLPELAIRKGDLLTGREIHKEFIRINYEKCFLIRLVEYENDSWLRSFSFCFDLVNLVRPPASSLEPSGEDPKFASQVSGCFFSIPLMLEIRQ